MPENQTPSATPGTDTEWNSTEGLKDGSRAIIMFVFARRQERELAAANQQILMDTECIERIRDAGMKAEVELAAVTAEMKIKMKEKIVLFAQAFADGRATPQPNGFGKVEEQQREIARLKEELDASYRFLIDTIAQRDKEIERLTSEIACRTDYFNGATKMLCDSSIAARAALRKYGRHEQSCCPVGWEKKDAVCTCGLTEALEDTK